MMNIFRNLVSMVALFALTVTGMQFQSGVGYDFVLNNHKLRLMQTVADRRTRLDALRAELSHGVTALESRFTVPTFLKTLFFNRSEYPTFLSNPLSGYLSTGPIVSYMSSMKTKIDSLDHRVKIILMAILSAAVAGFLFNFLVKFLPKKDWISRRFHELKGFICCCCDKAADGAEQVVSAATDTDE